MSGYTEYYFWSALLGCHASRLSMFNDQGHEYYTIITRVEGKAHRDNRYAALETLEAAISRGDQPGRVGKEHDA